MKHSEITPVDYEVFFIKVSLWVLFLGWTTFMFALFGFFYKWLIAAALLIGAAWMGKIFFKKNYLKNISLEMWLASIVLTALTIGFLSFSSPSVFSGRDQGALSEAAVRLAQNHNLEFSTPQSSTFFQIYGPGKALNFPGFHYTKDGSLMTQFPLVYIAWLGAFFLFFGASGFAIANGILLLFFLLAFYLLIRKFLSWRYGLLLMLFTATSFSFFWFSRLTLSENMALTLVWLMILSLMTFMEERSFFHYKIFFFCSALLVFTRIEGIALMLTSYAVLFLNAGTRTFLLSNRRKTILLPGIFFAFFFVLNGIKDFYFYKEIIKALFFPMKTASSGTMDSAIQPPVQQLYLTRLFLIYGYLGFLITSAISIAHLFIQKRFKLLIPFFLTLPTWTYLFDSHISSDHPWMLRRFAFTLIPVFIFYSVILFSFWKQERRRFILLRSFFLGILALLLLAGNIPTFAKYLTYSENRNLLVQTSTFAENFSAQDLVLMDKNVAGSGWAMPTGPMSFFFGKNTVYFFNPADLNKINTKPFENVYLVIPENKLDNYSDILDRFVPVKTFAFTTNHLSANQEKSLATKLPLKETTATISTIYKLKQNND